MLIEIFPQLSHSHGTFTLTTVIIVVPVKGTKGASTYVIHTISGPVASVHVAVHGGPVPAEMRMSIRGKAKGHARCWFREEH